MCGGGDLGSANSEDNDDKKDSGNSFKEGLANLFTPNDGFSYVDGRLTADRGRGSYTPDTSSGNPNEEASSRNRTVDDGKGGFFQVPKSETKKYNDGLVLSGLLGAITGGLPGIIAGVGGNAMRKSLSGGQTNKGIGSNATAQDTDLAVTAGGFTDPSTYVDGVHFNTTNDGGLKGMFQAGGTFAGPQFNSAEERSQYMLEQKNNFLNEGRMGGNDDDRVIQTVVDPVEKDAPDVPDMSTAAAEGAFQSIPNPDYDPNDPMSSRYLVNPSYAQLLEYQQSQVAGMAMGGLAQFAEGGELEVAPQEGGNEKTEIAAAVSAVKGDMSEEQASIVLGQFLSNYGEEALRDLVEKVKSGEYDDTVDRFANGEAGAVNGPGDGSGVDDKVPASLEGQQDVLLASGEYVLRKNTADALGKKYGIDFLDTLNESEKNAPRVLREFAAKTA
mgnify:FL=1